MNDSSVYLEARDAVFFLNRLINLFLDQIHIECSTVAKHRINRYYSIHK